MLFILFLYLLYFSFFYFWSSPFGQNKNWQLPITTSVLFTSSIIIIAGTFVSFFTGIDKVAEIAILTISAFGLKKLYTNRSQLKQQLLHRKAVFIWITSAIWASSIQRFPDEGIYYAQAILWSENWGLIKGLANFDLFLQQASGFHLLQGLFNTDILLYRSNDLNSFIIALFSIEFFTATQRKASAFLSYLIYPLLLLFGTTSSPDAIIILGSIVLAANINLIKPHLNAMLLLSLGLSLVKVTFVICCGVLILFLIDDRAYKKLALYCSSLLILPFKTFWLSGKLMAPFYLIPFPKTDHVIPTAVTYFNQLVGWQIGFKATHKEVASWSTFSPFMNLGRMELESWFTIVFTILFLAMVFLQKKASKKEKVFSFVVGLSLIPWLYYSPQYRLFIPFIAALAWMSLKHFPLNEKYTRVLLGSTLIMAFVINLVPFRKVPIINKSVIMQTFSGYHPQNLLLPMALHAPEAKEISDLSNFTFYRPQQRAYCYECTFPCNASMVRSFYSDSVYLPTLLGDDFRDGFGYTSIPISEIDSNFIAKYNAYSIQYWPWNEGY